MKLSAASGLFLFLFLQDSCRLQLRWRGLVFGPCVDEIREYQLYLLEERKLSPESVSCFISAA